MRRPPSHLLVENVVGFEASTTHDDLLLLLRQLRYCAQEFILSPTQFGVPNSRPRYFCIARASPFAVVSASGCVRTVPPSLNRSQVRLGVSQRVAMVHHDPPSL